ncbi:MAG: hypothetical protein J0G96_08070 [Flavobacteriia bacterium]|nr:hypothetical protein [Flavobacteriia bacterium]OJX36822.1 MAG: hypothetical protein BGO87_13630 [Flavobacteriia bacterium 40-80]
MSRLLLILSHVPVFAAFIYSVSVYRNVGSELKPLSWYLIATGTIHCISLALWFLHQNNLPLLHILVPMRFVLLVMMYSKILSGYVSAGIMYLLTGTFLIYSLISSLFFEQIDTFNSNVMTVENILLIILSLSTYVLLMDKRLNKHLGKYMKSVEWMNSGVFLYHSSSLILMYFGKHIIQILTPEFNRYIWGIHSLFMNVMYYCFWRALWKRNTT